MWVMWNLFSYYLETVLVSVKDWCMVCARCTIGSEIICTHLMAPLGDEAQVEARLVHLETVLILMHDRCIVCTERTIGSEIILDTLDGTPR